MSDALDALRDELDRFREERDWQRFHTLKNLAMALSVEAAELQELFQWVRTPEEELDILREQRQAVEDEVADVLIHLVNFASVAHIDLLAAARVKLTKNEQRYPPDRAKGSARKASPEGL